MSILKNQKLSASGSYYLPKYSKELKLLGVVKGFESFFNVTLVITALILTTVLVVNLYPTVGFFWAALIYMVVGVGFSSLIVLALNWLFSLDFLKPGGAKAVESEEALIAWLHERGFRVADDVEPSDFRHYAWYGFRYFRGPGFTPLRLAYLNGIGHAELYGTDRMYPTINMNVR